MPERPVTAILPPPERVGDAMIARCRDEVERRGKATLRRLLLPILRRRLRVAELGEGFQWGSNLLVGPGSRIGRYAYLGQGFTSHGPVVVGDLCMVAAGCRIVGADHRIDLPGTPTRLGWPTQPRGATIFGADAWVGERVTIREGISIGKGAIVGSGATVVSDVAPYTIVAGTPARLVRERFTAEDRTRHDALVQGSNGA